MHYKNQMKSCKAAGIMLVAFFMVESVQAQAHLKHEPIASSPSIETNKDPAITAAEQLSFVLCKKQQGQYKDYHDGDMREVLSVYGIDDSILGTDKVKSLTQKYIEDGVCDYFADSNRIFDLAPKAGEGEMQFEKLTGWNRELIVVFSEVECKANLDGLSNQERENHLLRRLGQVSYPSGVSEDDVEHVLKANLKAAIWLGSKKIANRNCLWMPR